MNLVGDRGGRQIVAGVLTLFALVLPALVAGTHIDAPRRAVESRALGLSDAPEPSTRSQPVELFFGSVVAISQVRARPEILLPKARLASLFGLLGISGLMYLLLTVVRGRATAVLACVVLALLPPVAREGFVLRPEIPAHLFGLLGMLLTAGLPYWVRRRRWSVVLPSILVIGMAFGVAAACLPRAGSYLLVPGGALLLLSASLLSEYPRFLRRDVSPSLAAMSRQLMPWLLLSLVVMAMMLVFLKLGVRGNSEELRPTVSGAGLLPASMLLSTLLLGLAVLGAAGMLIGTGMRFGRQRRITPDVLLMIYVAAELLQALLGPVEIDGLPAAIPFAMLTAEGGMLALVISVGLLTRRPTDR